MSEIKQAYILGQIYGYICSKNPNWSGVHNAYTAMKAGVIKPNDPYISARFAEIDPETAIPNTPQVQSEFTRGQLNFRRDVRRLIEKTGMTQELLAKKLGVKPLTVGRWYRGESNCPEDKKFEIEMMI